MALRRALSYEDEENDIEHRHNFSFLAESTEKVQIGANREQKAPDQQATNDETASQPLSSVLTRCAESPISDGSKRVSARPIPSCDASVCASSNMDQRVFGDFALCIIRMLRPDRADYH
jgi:hypothetical protein